MIVRCYVTQCPFLSKEGFCENRLVVIQENGFCGHIYDKHGNVRLQWQKPVEEQFKDKYWLKQEQE